MNHKNQTTLVYFHNGLWLSSLLLVVLTLVSCGGCRNGKSIEPKEVVDNSNVIIDPIASLEDTTTLLWLDQHYYRDTKIPLPDSLKSNPGLGIYYHHGNPALVNNTPRYINMLSVDDSNVDEYNVQKQILEFRNPNNGAVIKSIDLVKDNPFHKKGFKRRKEPYPGLYYFLEKKGTKNKFELRDYLPKETFAEIPNDFPFDRAISKVMYSTTNNSYATVSYELDWLPDAYSDQGEWDGPGYGVHFVVVYDSLGNKIYTRQFDGTSERPSMSHDGKYLFTMACLSPEWDDNIRYRFSVVNIRTDKVVYEELIDHCKKHGGGGNFYPEFYNANGYYAVLKDRQIKRYSYANSQFYTYYDNLSFSIISKSLNEVILKYPNGQEVVKSKDSIFTKIKLD